MPEPRLNICPDCGGSCYLQVMRMAWIDGEYTEQSERILCPTCDGSGRLVEFS